MYIDDPAGRVYGLCEVHFDPAGRVKSWSADPFRAPTGDNIYDLSGELMRMIVDAFAWAPVDHAKMHVGMLLQPQITAKQRDALAKMVEHAAVNLESAASPNPDFSPEVCRWYLRGLVYSV